MTADSRSSARPPRKTVHINRPPTRRARPNPEPLPLRGSGAHRVATPRRPWRVLLDSVLSGLNRCWAVLRK
ncbi:hypothetical protein BC739_003857 [Kutzneria viridogrisea]|uniref:Uncharacterized protein n=1 Tax=Kutzneria viridogrisea TaxID=47990 RepID=A0ABR6BIF1_9PSEU|nr:hypothetical protein [Kutzneria albida]MBA8926651.1 hypothetical protein [Kutzneria viridogrisea]